MIVSYVLQNYKYIIPVAKNSLKLLYWYKKLSNYVYAYIIAGC